MAVYTDVTAEDLGRFLAGYDVGELLSYKGIAEGVENSNFLVHTGRGHYILTLYERRVAERDLPFFLGLMEHLATPRHHLPAAGEEPRRQGAGPARRQARGDRHLPRRHVDSPAERGALRGARRGAGAAASCRRRFSDAPRQCALGRRLAAALRRLPRARAQGGAQSRDAGRRRARSAGTRLAARPAAGRHPRRSVSRTMCFSSATSCPG